MVVYAGIDPVTGRRTYHREKVAGTDKAAYRRAEKVLTNLQARVNAQRAPTSTVTLSYAIDEWLRSADIEESTRHGYEGYIERTIRPALGDVSVSKVTPRATALLRHRTSDRGNRPTDRGRPSGTRRRGSDHTARLRRMDRRRRPEGRADPRLSDAQASHRRNRRPRRLLQIRAHSVGSNWVTSAKLGTSSIMPISCMKEATTSTPSARARPGRRVQVMLGLDATRGDRSCGLSQPRPASPRSGSPRLSF